MAKDIFVQNMDGTTKRLNRISHIITDLQNGSTCIWVPKDEIELTGVVKLVYTNGMYDVVVNVPNVDGKKY